MKSVRLVSVSILRPPGNSLDNTVKHLKAAGALVHFFTKPTDLVAHIASDIPDCIFICTEYPPEQLQNTINVINKSFQIPIFGFSRTMSSIEKQMLTYLQFEATLESDINGPKAEAMILSYFEKKKKESENSKPASKPVLQDLASIQDFNRSIKKELVSTQQVKKEISKNLYNTGKATKTAHLRAQYSEKLEKYIRQTIQQIQNTSDQEFHDDQLSYEISELNIFEFQIESSNFIFVLAPLDDKSFKSENIESFKNIFLTQLTNDFPTAQISTQVQVTIPRSRIRDWLHDIGLSFTITSLWQHPCYLGIIENTSHTSFGIKKASDPNYLEVSILSIPMNIALPYTVFIYLNMNQVYFAYQTKGNVMTTKSLAKLSSLKINTVFINASEAYQYIQRITFKNISDTIYGYISKQNPN